ncbi:Tripartite tricarboxylate transporter family receptor [compost metagenome]
MLARIVGAKLSERLGQPVVIENKPGAGGDVGTAYVAKQPADGYTIVMGNIGPIAINPTLTPDARFSPTRDLAPVTLLAEVPNSFSTRSNSPIPCRTQRLATEHLCTWRVNCSLRQRACAWFMCHTAVAAPA